MAKGCLNKLSGNITVRCTIPQVGIKNIYLIHTEDVTFTVAGIARSTITGATIPAGASVILVEGYKQNIQITSAVRAMDASAKLDINVSFKMPMKSDADFLRARSLLAGTVHSRRSVIRPPWSAPGWTGTATRMQRWLPLHYQPPKVRQVITL